jgi:hypothetical protein
MNFIDYEFENFDGVAESGAGQGIALPLQNSDLHSATPF